MTLPPPASADHVPSPCNRVCTIDPATGLCRGCKRSLDEIRDWIEMSPEERRAVLADLARR